MTGTIGAGIIGQTTGGIRTIEAITAGTGAADTMTATPPAGRAAVISTFRIGSGQPRTGMTVRRIVGKEVPTPVGEAVRNPAEAVGAPGRIAPPAVPPVPGPEAGMEAGVGAGSRRRGGRDSIFSPL